DERADFLAGEHLVHARALDVEDFAAQRQHRLERAIAALLGRAAGAVALDDEQFRFRGVALLAIGEFAGQRRHIERALPARELARLARGLPRRRPRAPAAAPTTLPTLPLVSAGSSPSQYCSASLMTASTTGRTSEETSLSLVCEENFGSGTLQESTAVSPSRQSSPVSATRSFCATPLFSA